MWEGVRIMSHPEYIGKVGATIGLPIAIGVIVVCYITYGIEYDNE